MHETNTQEVRTGYPEKMSVSESVLHHPHLHASTPPGAASATM